MLDHPTLRAVTPYVLIPRIGQSLYFYHMASACVNTGPSQRRLYLACGEWQVLLVPVPVCVPVPEFEGQIEALQALGR